MILQVVMRICERKVFVESDVDVSVHDQFLLFATFSTVSTTHLNIAVGSWQAWSGCGAKVGGTRRS